MRVFYFCILSVLLTFGSLFLFSSCDETSDTTENNSQEQTDEKQTDDEKKNNSTDDNSVFSSEEISSLNTAANVDYLSDDEKQVILLCNLARYDGSRFRKGYAEPFLNGKSSDAIKSLFSDLEKTKGVQALKPLQAFCNSAASHAEDMGNSGNTGHNSTDGRSMSDRLWKANPNAMEIAENCSYGFSKPIEIVMQLLVDDGLTPPGHRNTILSDKYNVIGVAIRQHKTWKYNCVQDFADR